MTPFPLFYTPQGVTKPACCPHLGAVDVIDQTGPDAVRQADGTITGGDGRVWGGGLKPGQQLPWLKSPAGWYICPLGLVPQSLRRVTTHPRILRWRRVPGIHPDHRWLVPVLITSDEDGDPVLAIDRVLASSDWQAGDEFASLIERLLAVRQGTLGHEDPALRNAESTALGLELLALGQFLDRDLAVTMQWISERVLVDVLRAALDWEPVNLDDESAEA